MQIETRNHKSVKIALIRGREQVLTDPQTALDLIVTVKYETGCSRIALPKEAVAGDFFVLSTRLAGEILQKFINYQSKLAIYGDFSRYTSKPLKDFIYESNRGADVFFAADEADALEKLAAAR